VCVRSVRVVLWVGSPVLHPWEKSLAQLARRSVYGLMREGVQGVEMIVVPAHRTLRGCGTGYRSGRTQYRTGD